MKLETLVIRMKSVPLRELQAIAQKAGVPYGTALKIRGGFTRNPGALTVEALEPFFQDRPQPDTQALQAAA